MADGNLAVSVLMRAVDQISGPVKRIQGRLGRFRSQAQAIGRRVGFERLASSLGRAGHAGRELVGVTARLATRIGALGGGAAAAGGALVHLFASSTESTRQWAERLGIAQSELERLSYAGQQYGVQQGALVDGLKELSMRTDEYVQTAKGPGAEAFQRLRLSQQDLARVSGDTGKLFELVASRLREVENVAARQRLVDEIFGGEGGQQMAAMASASAEEIAAFKRQADALGVTVGRDGTAAAQDYMAAWREAKGAMTGVRNTIGVSLLPVMTDLLSRVSELVVEYRPAIKEWAETFAEKLPGRLESLQSQFSALLERLQPAIDLGASLVDQFGAVNTAAGALAVVVGGTLVGPFVKLGAALWSVASAAIPAVVGALNTLAAVAMAHPIGALITVLVGGAAALIASWSTVGPWFRDLWEGFTEWAGSAMDALWSILQRDPIDVMADGFSRALEWLRNIDWAGAASAAWEGIKTVFHWSPIGLLYRGFGRAMDWLGSLDWAAVAAGAWEGIKTVYRWSPLGIMQDAFGRAINWLGSIDWSEHGKRLLQTLASGIKAMATAPFEAVKGVLGKVRNLLPFSDAKEGPLSALTESGGALVKTLADGANGARDALLSTLTGIAGAARDALGGAWDTVTGWFGGGEDPERQATIKPVLGELPELPTLRGEARFLAEVVGMGRALDGARAALSLEAPASSGGGESRGAGEPVTVPASELGRSRVAPAGGGAVTVQKVEFSPSLVIQAGPDADAEAAVDLVDQRLERWRSRDLWEQIQGVRETD